MRPRSVSLRYMAASLLAALLLFSVSSAAAGGSAERLVLGVDHVGLTVRDLAKTTEFFVDVLGFELFKTDESYPANFVRNGHIVVTLWRAKQPDKAIAFDRKNNIGLHHLALRVDDFDDLDAMHERLKDADGVVIEFAPEPLGGGPARHMMFREPSGNRMELIHRPRSD